MEENKNMNTAAAAADEELRVTEKAVEMLRTVYDPEIPVNIYDLGLIYKIDYDVADKTLHVDMTLTAPSCPAWATISASFSWFLASRRWISALSSSRNGIRI